MCFCLSFSSLLLCHFLRRAHVVIVTTISGESFWGSYFHTFHTDTFRPESYNTERGEEGEERSHCITATCSVQHWHNQSRLVVHVKYYTVTMEWRCFMCENKQKVCILVVVGYISSVDLVVWTDGSSQWRQKTTNKSEEWISSTSVEIRHLVGLLFIFACLLALALATMGVYRWDECKSQPLSVLGCSDYSLCIHAAANGLCKISQCDSWIQ